MRLIKLNIEITDMVPPGPIMTAWWLYESAVGQLGRATAPMPDIGAPDLPERELVVGAVEALHQAIDSYIVNGFEFETHYELDGDTHVARWRWPVAS
jgi:hypothetical protein